MHHFWNNHIPLAAQIQCGIYFGIRPLKRFQICETDAIYENLGSKQKKE
jgi:hypothetical protein